MSLTPRSNPQYRVKQYRVLQVASTAFNCCPPTTSPFKLHLTLVYNDHESLSTAMQLLRKQLRTAEGTACLVLKSSETCTVAGADTSIA